MWHISFFLDVLQKRDNPDNVHVLCVDSCTWHWQEMGR